MKVFLFFTTFLIGLIQSTAQKPYDNFSIEPIYGANINFRLSGYNETPGPFYTTAFFKKHLLGSVGGLNFLMSVSKKSNIGIGYMRSANTRTINYSGANFPVDIYNWRIYHVNNIYQVFYRYAQQKNKQKYFANAGLFYVRPLQQEIELIDRQQRGSVLFEERSYKRNRLEEGGAFLGLGYKYQLAKNVGVGVQSNLYFTISTNRFELLSLTPTVSFDF